MIQKKNRQGVSPVVGVILMVAITVIIAAVVANFVLDLGQQLGQDAEATLNFEQSIDDFGSETYQVQVTVSDMQNSDYLVVTTAGSSSGYSFDEDLSDTTVPDNAPDYSTPGNSQSIADSGDGGMILYRSGDRVTISSDSDNLKAGDTIQVFGGLSGEESLIQEYNVKDTLG